MFRNGFTFAVCWSLIWVPALVVTILVEVKP
jgi:hypothetical protein